MVSTRSIGIELGRTLVSIIVWRILDSLVSYAQTGMLQLLPTFQVSSLLTLIVAFIIVFGAFYVLGRRKHKIEAKPVLPAPRTLEDLERELQAFIEADPALTNLSGYLYPDEIEIRARANRLNDLAATAKGFLGSDIDMNDYTVNADSLVQQGRDVADGHMKRIASLLLGKVREHAHKHATT